MLMELRDQISVMGILNVTPDSFSDGGRFNRLDAAFHHAEQMVAAGAAVLDIGGESTRPGAAEVSVQDELERVIPVVEGLRQRFDTPVSVDTSKPEVMSAAIRAGAAMINDVRALQEPGALEACAAAGVDICLMHMQGQPRTMQQNPVYTQLLDDIAEFFVQRIQVCEQAGIARQRLWLDPGFGFGQTLAHNLELLKKLDELNSFDLPLLVGLSRKSMISTLLGGRPVDERLHGSVAAAVLAVWQGARMVRAHDVKATVDALQIVRAAREA
ncbi:MAG: dihydropteroate synthase [Thiolinea sp.]